MQPSYQEFLTYIHPEDRAEFKNVIDNALANGGRFDIEFRYIKGPSEKRLRDVGFITVEDGVPVFAKGSMSDITDRHAIIQELKDIKALHEHGQKLNGWGNWLWNLQTGKLQWSQEMYAIFDIAPGTEITLGGFLTMVDPEYKEIVREGIENPVTSEYLFSVTTPLGNRKTIRGKSKVERNDKDIITLCYGSCLDVTSAIAATSPDMAHS